MAIWHNNETANETETQTERPKDRETRHETKAQQNEAQTVPELGEDLQSIARLLPTSAAYRAKLPTILGAY